MRKFLFLLFAIWAGIFVSNAQTLITGTVQDAEYGQTLAGAIVKEKGTDNATMTDLNGDFTLETTKDKTVLVISFVGYETKEIEVETQGKKRVDLGNISLNSSGHELNEIYVVADRASEQKTPVALSSVKKKTIEYTLGSRDLPLVMNATPSVYATAQGGGSGDARINVRGFDQRNVAIMINGVPVNDMENGWVYWSNWDGIADVTSSIQLQRGLSAVNLATPSVGGTLNIITSPAAKKQSGVVKFEYGSGNFMKATAAYNTGLINDKFAMSIALVRKQGKGVIDKTWTDAYAYYLGMTYKINQKNKIELFALGAPQRHGHNLYQQNLAAYDSTYFMSLPGADHATVEKFRQSDRGRLYNQNWNVVDPDYDGLQFWNGKTHKRYNPNFINERENYYHKPLVNLNIYNHFSNNVALFTVLYYSGGTGGGSGTFGHLVWDYESQPSRIPDWNATIENNTRTDTAFGILRNSVNKQWTLGALSKLRITFNKNLKAQIGIDVRKAQIEHYREVRDLLGGKFYYFTGNFFDTEEDYKKVLGDKIDYYFTNDVEWAGYYAQTEYSNDKITAYLTLGNSYVRYAHTNHFVPDPQDNTKELYLRSKVMSGYQVKTGVSFRPTDWLKTYVNLGYISKVPIFDNVISDRLHSFAPNPQNEIFQSAEVGGIIKNSAKTIDLRFNYYYTLWKNRAITLTTYNQATEQDELTFITGLNELHQGVEIETYFKPSVFFNFSLAASLANWVYTNNVSSQYSVSDPETGEITTEDYVLYLKGIKVGDAPQSQFSGALIFKPVKGLRVQLEGFYYSNYYARFDPTTRTDPNDTRQVWRVPDYYLLNSHIFYKFKIGEKNYLTLFGHVFNILDALYVSDATDNSKYTALDIHNPDYSHTVNNAGVFVGLPRTFNVGLKFEF